MEEYPIRAVAVNYINTVPFLHGLEAASPHGMELQLANPAECARLLLTEEADLGLIPVAAIPQMKEAHIVTDFCIGADGPVESVCLFSEAPIAKVTEILLDFQSRTSVQLMRILAQRHFDINPKWTDAEQGFINDIKGTTAGVVIGDRAFPLRERFPVVIDLAEEWKRLTGLPFVFACWVSTRELPTDFLMTFNAALKDGVVRREEAVRSRVRTDVDAMVHYVNQNISYELDDRKREALKLFTQWSGSD